MKIQTKGMRAAGGMISGLVCNCGAHALGDLGKGLVHAAIVPGVTLQPAPAAHEFFEQRLCSFFAAGTKKGHHGGKPGWPNA